MSIFPIFGVVSYYPNPAFFQVGQAVLIQPVPGFSAASYALTGSLPSGLSFNTTTGIISGTPVALLAATQYTVTATNADSSTSECQISLSVIAEPEQAQLANEGSATDLNNIMLRAEQIFIDEVTQMITNANGLGRFSLFANLSDHVSFMAMKNYFNSLNYSFELSNCGQAWYNGNFYVAPFGQFGDCFAFPWTSPYPYFGSPYGFPVKVPTRPKVLITWNGTPRFGPYYGWYPTC